ncbi:MAG: glutathione S-transferase family protein [Myxococcota bacterium]|nr:glutathione S-transferase family protein [Myxococcota bacterium]
MTDVIAPPETLPELTLVYAKMQALAEPARMLMHYAGLAYTDVYPWDHYGAPWKEGGKQKTPFGQVPVLVVDGHTSIDQSGAIQRYLGRITGTCPADALLAAQADALVDNAGELFVISNPVANFFTGERFEAKVAAFQTSFGPRLGYFARALAAIHDGPFFFGATPMFCDFTIFHHFQIAELLIPDVFSEHAGVEAFMTAMANLPGLADYLANRPSLSGVGTAPVLMQGDTVIKPGFA